MLPLSLGYRTSDLTLPAILARQARERGGQRFLTWLPDGRSWTFAEADRDSTRLAHGLAARGVRKGTHVALMLENSPEFLLLCFALGKLGAVTVPINTAARGTLLDYYLKQSDTELLIKDPGEIEPGPDTPLDAQVLYSDLAYILYTSGTTGPSKGNMMCQAAALSVGLSNVEHHGYRDGDVLYACLPLFHMNALHAASYAALVAGLPLALAPRFSASNYWKEVRAAGATVTNMLGSMASILWNQPPSPDDRSTLRMVTCVPTPPFAREFEQRFGPRLVGSYGISDYGLVTAYTVNDPPEKLGSAGRARRGFEVKVVDDEIVVRCDDAWRVASGYYNMPEKTAETRRDGWFYTGDRGALDAEGYLWFTGRKKDAIRRSGENISAFEVESIIDAHPAVAESAVFALPAAGGEDEVAACVVLKPDAKLTEAELVAYCAENMAYFMVPRYVRYRTDLPRTLNHKVEKFKLRGELAADPALAWDRERAGILVKRRP
jgi:crotonobetaine/carnitine-CoA ligase